VAGLFDGPSAGTLKRLADAVRSGQLGVTPSSFSIAKAVPGSESAGRDIVRLATEGLSAAHLALLLEATAEAVDARAERVAADLVWTGPEVPGTQSRDTAAVLQELFAGATRDVIVSTFVVRQVESVFRPLALRMTSVPELRARIFLHVGRKNRDTVDESELLREFADQFRRDWPGPRLPEVFYDPRGVGAESADRATWHAKCVVVDEELAFVTSANFTEWAQDRNIEAGVLLRSPRFAAQLRQQFESLVRAKLVRRVPGL
jgi:phosphatidylserine/phosphatidylglycerophosphate/cardiolipin synthase-like enzyme